MVIFFQGKTQPYVWTQKMSYTGFGTAGVCAFSIGSKGYFCSGLDNSLTAHNDCWQYDPATNSWTQKADAGTTTRYSASAFSISGKGYICLGWELLGGPALNDLLEYDTLLNTWTAKANFPGAARYNGVAFVVNNKAYVGLGYTPVLDDIYEYDPVSDTWTILANTFPGGARTSASAFSANNKGYITFGSLNPDVNTLLANDLWEFTPGAAAGSGTWLAKSNFPGSARFGAFAFSLNGNGYVGGGIGLLQAVYADFYQYDPLNDTWTPEINFPGINKIAGKSFVINNKGYVGTGQDLSIFYPDFYEYAPSTNSVNENFNTHQITLTISADNYLSLKFNDFLNQECLIEIFSADGKLNKSLKKNSASKSAEINFNGKQIGIYFYSITSDSKILKSGKFFFK